MRSRRSSSAWSAAAWSTNAAPSSFRPGRMSARRCSSSWWRRSAACRELPRRAHRHARSISASTATIASALRSERCSGSVFSSSACRRSKPARSRCAIYLVADGVLGSAAKSPASAAGSRGRTVAALPIVVGRRRARGRRQQRRPGRSLRRLLADLRRQSRLRRQFRSFWQRLISGEAAQIALMQAAQKLAGFAVVLALIGCRVDDRYAR